MSFTKEDQQRKEFRDLLLDLAKSQALLKEPAERVVYYRRLEKLYYSPNKEESFRHFYSDIFSVLTQIRQNPEELGDIEILGQNIKEIRKKYQGKNPDGNGKIIDISSSIRKLDDHVSLDIARLTYSDGLERRLSKEESVSNIQTQVNKINFEINKANSSIENANEDIEKFKDSLNKHQKDYIAILGIFAAVVLAFTGGMAFSTSVLQNFHVSSVYRVVLICLLIAFVLVNVLYALFQFIDKLIHDDKKQKIYPLLLTNIFIAVFLLLTFLAWNSGFVEKRNERINIIPEQKAIVKTEKIKPTIKNIE